MELIILRPYVNRIIALSGDPFILISNTNRRIQNDHYNCKILAASFHTTEQIKKSISAGAQAITTSIPLLRSTYQNASIISAISTFSDDWKMVYGKGASL